MSIEVASQNRPAAVRMADEQRTARRRSHHLHRHGLRNITRSAPTQYRNGLRSQRDGDAGTITRHIIELPRYADIHNAIGTCGRDSVSGCQDWSGVVAYCRTISPFRLVTTAAFIVTQGTARTWTICGIIVRVSRPPKSGVFAIPWWKPE